MSFHRNYMTYLRVINQANVMDSFIVIARISYSLLNMHIQLMLHDAVFYIIEMIQNNLIVLLNS